MPGYRIHIGGGVVVYCGLIILISTFLINKPSFFLALEWFFCCIAGALFPDIDIKSKGQLIYYRVLSICLIYFLWKRKIVLFIWMSLLSIFPLIVRHRGIFHQIWFVGIIGFATAVALSFYYPSYQKILFIDATFFFMGAVSHILFDQWGTQLKKIGLK